MGMKIASLLALLLCLTILLIILTIVLSVYLSVSKQHNLFLSTYEFIVVKRNSRLVVFFLSNVIIIKIFRGSSTTLKPSEELDFDSLPFFSHSVYEANATADEAACEDCSDSDIDQDGDEYHGYDGYDEDNDDDGSDDDLESEDEEDYKDLERRIEEFISKNYKQRNEEQIHERFLYMASMENYKNPALAR